MTDAQRMSGVLCPVVTPFHQDLSVDAGLLLTQCNWLLSQGVGLAVFGTNSEANSLGAIEKADVLSSLVANGIVSSRLMPGTGGCALPETIALTRTAVELGCAGVLMLPPFYYKAVDDDGLFAYFAEVIERVGDERLRIYLYHIPPVAQVGLSPALVERLVKAYPGAIAGIKDSSGEWSNTEAILALQLEDFRVFVGSETLLLRNMQAGGAGCISATANINPAAIVDLFAHWQAAGADARQQALCDLRDIVQRLPMIAALKATVAHYSGNDDWLRVRPPLRALASAERESLIRALTTYGFDMPGLISTA